MLRSMLLLSIKLSCSFRLLKNFIQIRYFFVHCATYVYCVDRACGVSVVGAPPAPNVTRMSKSLQIRRLFHKIFSKLTVSVLCSFKFSVISHKFENQSGPNVYLTKEGLRIEHLLSSLLNENLMTQGKELTVCIIYVLNLSILHCKLKKCDNCRSVYVKIKTTHKYHL